MHDAVVIEEWPLARAGIATVLPAAGVRVRSGAGTATAGFAEVTADTRLVVIGACPDATARHAVRRAATFDVAIVVLIPAAEASSVLELCSLGAHAVISRDASEEELTTAVRHALAGDRYVPSRLLSGAFQSPRMARPVRPRFDLTRRETAVLAELAAGRSNQEIAERLCIGSETVKTHLGNIYMKLSVRRRHQAVGVALQHGLV